MEKLYSYIFNYVCFTDLRQFTHYSSTLNTEITIILNLNAVRKSPSPRGSDCSDY